MKTVILGATPNTSRYAYSAASMLDERGLEFIPVGIKEGEVFNRTILNLREKPAIDDVHTVTLYIGPQNQREWYEYILGLKPKRIIFNPGTENPELIDLAKADGIECDLACTLVLLSTNNYAE